MGPIVGAGRARGLIPRTEPAYRAVLALDQIIGPPNRGLHAHPVAHDYDDGKVENAGDGGTRVTA
jgi:hypothetical protein